MYRHSFETDKETYAFDETVGWVKNPGDRNECKVGPSVVIKALSTSDAAEAAHITWIWASVLDDDGYGRRAGQIRRSINTALTSRYMPAMSGVILHA